MIFSKCRLTNNHILVMNNNLPPIKVFAGENSQYLGESICKELGIELGKMKKEKLIVPVVGHGKGRYRFKI